MWAAAGWCLPLCPGESEQHLRGEKHFSNTRKATLPLTPPKTSCHFLKTWFGGEIMQLQKMSPHTGPQHLLPCTVNAGSAWKHLPRHGTTGAKPGQGQPGIPLPAEQGTRTWVQTDPTSQGRAVVEGRDHLAYPKPPHRDPRQPRRRHVEPGLARCLVRHPRSGYFHHPGQRRTASPWDAAALSGAAAACRARLCHRAPPGPAPTPTPSL